MLFSRICISTEVLSYFQLQRAFERGDIKPGLNFAADIDERNKEMKNDVVKLFVFVIFICYMCIIVCITGELRVDIFV